VRSSLLALAVLPAALLSASGEVAAATCTSTPWSGMAGVPPLTDYPPGYLYLGQYQGFLYEGSNVVPADHDADGRALAGNILPRDTSGNVCPTPGPGCRVVFLAIGFSNTTIEFCGGNGINGDPEDPSASQCPLPTANPPYIQTQSFIAQALADPAVNHATVVLVDGARGGATLEDWDPTVSGYTEYDRTLNQILIPAGLSAGQVQSVWLKSAESHPTVSLATGGPGNPADAIVAERHMGNIARAVAQRYPNAKQLFITSRIYGGYANTMSPPNPLNPEPYAYEEAFAVKWLADSQIRQIRGDPPTTDAGDLDYRTGVAPWLAWGPYPWANGTTPRSDGLVWLNSDFRVNECTHPSVYAEEKVEGMLLDFMKMTPYTSWFLASPTVCAVGPRSLRIAPDKQTIFWSANLATGPFDVAKGGLEALRETGTFGATTCRDNLTTTSTTDPGAPPPHAGFFYLVRCDGGTWNDGTQVEDRDLTLTSCP